MPDPVLLALVWHMHQPLYVDPESGTFRLPWTRLHATKDYRDMPALLRRTPRVHVTFNLTPSLMAQLDLVGRGLPDPYLEVARARAEDLGEEQQEFLRSRFFDVQRERMLEPYARYRELYERAHAAGPGRVGVSRDRAEPLSTQDFRDLQVWFHLAWIDPMFREEEPVRSLFAKGRGFSESEKQTLLDWGAACAKRVEGEYRSLEASGQCELSTSAYHHPILPLLIDTDAPREVSESIRLPVPPMRALEDAEEQVRRAVQDHERRFGRKPKGTWPPEGAVNDATLELLAGAGLSWAASDEAVLSRALAADGRGVEGWPRALYRPYRIETTRGPIEMVFRDRKLSDLIGFTYGHWEPERAAEDFLARVRSARDAAPGGRTPLVTVILDGENCWESYPDDGGPFLRALYDLLGAGGEVEAVTVSEGLARVQAKEPLRHVPVGSWIRADLGIWVGHPDKTRAWEELGAARAAVQRARAAGASGESLAAAREELLAAEASDWFWWYGDDHPSAHRLEFDALYRSRLARAYAAVGAVVPSSLLESLREDAGVEGLLPSGEERDEAVSEFSTIPYVRPVVDGRETDFFEWRLASLYRVAGAAGSMHRTSAALREVRFGTDGRSLHLRLDFEEKASELGDASVSLVLPGPPERSARVHWAGVSMGAPEWMPVEGETEASPGRAESAKGDCAVGEIVEVSLPLARCGGVPGRGLRFRVVLERAGMAEEFVPTSGWFLLAVPVADLDLSFWTAL